MLRKKIIHFTGTDQRKQANAAFLIGCYMVSVPRPKGQQCAQRSCFTVRPGILKLLFPKILSWFVSRGHVFVCFLKIIHLRKTYTHAVQGACVGLCVELKKIFLRFCD